MSEEVLPIGVVLSLIGAFLLMASPTLSPMLNQNVGLWGMFFLLLGLIITGVRLWTMAQRA